MIIIYEGKLGEAMIYKPLLHLFSAPVGAVKIARLLALFPAQVWPRCFDCGDRYPRASGAGQEIEKGSHLFQGNSLVLLAGPTGLEPATSGVTGRHSNQLNYDPRRFGGRNRDRTCDPRLVRPMLSQLSYSPSPNDDAYLP
jgi:hypothetical protein